jgi:cell division protein ZapA
MSQVSVTVNGKSYVLACGEGEEQHLVRLARAVDQRIAGIVASAGQVGEARLLLVAALMATDELWDATRQIEALRALGDPATYEKANENADPAAGVEIEALAERIEAIAERLKAT